MLLANFNRKEHLRHRAVSLRQHGFLVQIAIVLVFVLSERCAIVLVFVFVFVTKIALGRWGPTIVNLRSEPIACLRPDRHVRNQSNTASAISKPDSKRRIEGCRGPPCQRPPTSPRGRGQQNRHGRPRGGCRTGRARRRSQ